MGIAYFHDMIKVVAFDGPSYKPASLNELCRRYLNEEMKHVENEIMRMRE